MKILMTIIAMLMTQIAQASFLDNCDFDMKISEVGVITTPEASLPNYARQVKATVLAVTDKGGHTDCTYHVGKEYDMKLVSPALSDLALLQPEYRISVEYFHVNSLTPSGVISRTSYTLNSKAQSAYGLAIVDQNVTDKVAELQQTLGNGNEPVVLLAGEAMSLKEGICGFVGCDTVHLITLTYGMDFQNSPRETIVIKVNLSALEESSNVEIL